MKSKTEVILTSSIKIQIVSSQQYEEKREGVIDKIEQIWAGENEKRIVPFTNSNLFNVQGLSWSFDEGFILNGFFVQYKDFLAQRVKKGVDLEIRPLGVSGVITYYDDEIGLDLYLFGKRNDAMTQYPSYFELVPSGGVDDKFVEADSVLFVKNLICEMKEELGWPETNIKKNETIGIVIDKKESMYDIILKMVVYDHINIKESKEYTEFIYVKSSEIDTFISSNKIVPTSISIFQFP